MNNKFWIDKRYAFIILFLCFNASCSKAQIVTNSNISEVKPSETQASKFDDTAAKLIESYKKKNCKEFVNAFPNNFQAFNDLYGYEDKKGGHILYSKPEHIDYFFNCPEVSDSEKLNKIIQIGINGKWDADVIGEFQTSSYTIVKKHSDETKQILDKLSEEKAASFWYFLFDGPHPSDKENISKYEELIKLLGEKSKQTKLLSEQFKKLQKLEQEDKESGVISSN